MSIILGIDPGSRATGYGVLEVDDDGEAVVHYGVLRLDGADSDRLRLKQIYSRVEELVEEYLPDVCAIEMPVYGQNPQSMLKLGRAQAAAMLAALNREVAVFEYAPKEVKKAVTGNGNATKQQVWYMVRALLEIDDDDPRMGLDASDALAVGLCHAHRGEEESSGRHRDWAAFVRDNPHRTR